MKTTRGRALAVMGVLPTVLTFSAIAVVADPIGPIGDQSVRDAFLDHLSLYAFGVIPGWIVGGAAVALIADGATTLMKWMDGDATVSNWVAAAFIVGFSAAMLIPALYVAYQRVAAV
jgi:hypothetical protein